MNKIKRNVLGVLTTAMLLAGTCATVTLQTGTASAEVTSTGTPMSFSVSLSNDIVYNCTLSIEDANSPYAKFTFLGRETTVEGTWNGEKYAFAFDGVTPQYLGESIDVKVYASQDAQDPVATSTGGSVQAYCETLLTKAETDGSTAESEYLRSLVVDMLNYGAAAQVYTNTNTGALANANVSQAYATEFETPTSVTSITKGDNDVFTWHSAGLYCDSTLAVWLKVNVPEEVTDMSAYTVKVNGGSTADFKGLSNGVATYYYTGITPAQFADTLNVQVFEDTTAVSGTLTYSVNSYVASKENSSTAGLADLVKSVYSYGKSVYAYSNHASLQYAVNANPTETANGTATATSNGYNYTVQLPAINTTDWTLNGGRITINEDVLTGTFTNAKYNVTVEDVAIADGIYMGGFWYSAYDISAANNEALSATREDGSLKVNVANNLDLGNIKTQGNVILDASTAVTATLSQMDISGKTTIGSNLTISANCFGGYGVKLAGELTVNGGLEFTGTGSDWLAVGFIQDNAKLNINGKLTATEHEIHMGQNATSNQALTIGEGADINWIRTYWDTNYAVRDENMGNGNQVIVTGGTSTFRGPWWIETMRVYGGSIALNKNDNNSTLIRSQHLAIHGGSLTTDHTLYADKVVVKGGALNINVTNDGDRAGITPLSSDGQCRYYFMGGETNIVRTGGSGSAAIFAWGKSTTTAVAVGGYAKVTFSGFSYAIYMPNPNSYNYYGFTAYVAEGTELGSDQSYEFGLNYSGCDNYTARETDFDFWNTISDAGYWTDNLGIIISGFNDLQNKDLSAYAMGEINFAAI